MPHAQRNRGVPESFPGLEYLAPTLASARVCAMIPKKRGNGDDPPKDFNISDPKLSVGIYGVTASRMASTPPRKLGALRVAGVRCPSSSLHVGTHTLEKRDPRHTKEGEVSCFRKHRRTESGGSGRSKVLSMRYATPPNVIATHLVRTYRPEARR